MMISDDTGSYTGFLGKSDSTDTYNAIVIVDRKDSSRFFDIEIQLPPNYIESDYPSWVFSGEPPTTVIVRSSVLDGICLVGCWGGERSSLGLGFETNSVYLNARHVVHTDEDAAKIFGMRSQMKGLEIFLRGTKISIDKPVTASSTSGPFSTFIIQKDHHGTEGTFFQSSTSRPSKWGAHILTHRQVMEVLTIANWKKSEVIGNQSIAMSKDQIYERYWNRMDRSPLTVARSVSGTSASALFRLIDLGPNWLEDWSDLRRRFTRGMLAFVSLVERRNELQLENQCIQLGAVIEFIATDLGHEARVLTDGGKIMKDKRPIKDAPPSSLNYSRNNKLEEKWKKDSFKFDYEDKVALIYSQIPKVKGLSSSWVHSMPDTYNKTKHIDKNKPIGIDRMIRDIDTGMEVVRIWVATQLGVDASMIRRYYAHNPIKRKRTRLRDI